MLGQKKLTDEKDVIIQKYLEEHDPYNPPKITNMDLRGYSKYVKEHNIPHDKIPVEVMEMFVKKD